MAKISPFRLGEIKESMEQQLWNGLLHLRKEVAAWSSTPEFCCINIWESEVVLNQLLPTNSGQPLIIIHFTEAITDCQDATHFYWNGAFDLSVGNKGKMPAEALSFLRAYLPYCLFALPAKKRQRTISIAHFAQTLDGKIATHSGHSKWIGNEENLKHAHRMRALCDAILIGRSTLFYDKPSLTVRHVSGENPHRVVLGTKEADFSCLFEACNDPVSVLGCQKNQSNGKIKYGNITPANGRLHSNQVLDYLYQQGYHTVYIEGGAVTTSNFIVDGAVDILQLHLSPQIFGSGRQAIVLPEIEVVKESIQFSNFHYQSVGDTLMFVGQLKRGN